REAVQRTCSRRSAEGTTGVRTEPFRRTTCRAQRTKGSIATRIGIDAPVDQPMARNGVDAVASGPHLARDGAARETRSLPLHERHRGLGAHFVHVAGWELPGWYDDPIMEHRAARHVAGLTDASHQGLVVLRGRTVERFSTAW